MVFLWWKWSMQQSVGRQKPGGVWTHCTQISGVQGRRWHNAIRPAPASVKCSRKNSTDCLCLRRTCGSTRPQRFGGTHGVVPSDPSSERLRHLHGRQSWYTESRQEIQHCDSASVRGG